MKRENLHRIPIAKAEAVAPFMVPGVLLAILSIVGIVAVSTHNEVGYDRVANLLFWIIGLAVAVTLIVIGVVLLRGYKYTDRAGLLDFLELQKFDKKYNMFLYWDMMKMLTHTDGVIESRTDYVIEKNGVKYIFSKEGLSIDFNKYQGYDTGEEITVTPQKRFYSYENLKFTAHISERGGKYKFIWLISDMVIPENDKGEYVLHFPFDENIYYFLHINGIEVPNLKTLMNVKF